jgi:hypothetical protein
MKTAVAYIDRLKARDGWVTVIVLRSCKIHNRTLDALWLRGLIQKFLVGSIDRDNCVRLTKLGRRYV